jgi:DNA polymerase-3 subunit delta'
MNSFAKLIGQKQAIDLLTLAVNRDRIAPAYLFVGPDGVGKSLAARCFIRILLCNGIAEEKHQQIQERVLAGNHPDFLWVQPTYLHQGQFLTATEAAAAGVKRKAPPQIRIEQIREITQFLSRPPLEASRSVIAIEEAHTMTEAAANALLKTLEEPGRATLILIAPDADALLPTLVSRTQRIPFSRLSREDLDRVLRQLGYAEICQHPEILEIAQGSPGEAITSFERRQAIRAQLLETLVNMPNNALHALKIAREIDKELDIETQLWLVDYLQYSSWLRWRDRNTTKKWEQTKNFLLSYAQPRLVWECALLGLLHK